MNYATVAITVEELAAALESPQPPAVLDVTFHLGGPPGRLAYDEAHIPGAVFVDLETAFSTAAGAGGRHPLPPADVTEAALRAVGVRTGQSVVVYDAANSLTAARAWFVLRLYGLTDVRVLDGGLAAWRAAGSPVTDEVPAVPEGDVRLSRDRSFEVLDADRAAAWPGVLLDARAPERFRGDVEPIDPVAGHIPGAVNLPMADLLAADGRLRPADELVRRFADAAGGEPVAAYCGSGITAAHTAWAYASVGGTCTVYAGSWSDWITDSERPVANGN